jgi:hypothetical protein
VADDDSHPVSFGPHVLREYALVADGERGRTDFHRSAPGHRAFTLTTRVPGSDLVAGPDQGSRTWASPSGPRW